MELFELSLVLEQSHVTMVGVVRSGKPITKRICIVCMCTESGVV